MSRSCKASGGEKKEKKKDWKQRGAQVKNKK
jgi:hypothetical protein